MLGIKPTASVQTSQSNPSGVNGSSSTQEAQTSVKAALEVTDMEAESSEEAEPPRGAVNHEEDESRYDIRDKRQPPAKRRRLGTRQDQHTVYTSDEDDDEAVNVRGGDGKLVLHADLDESGSESSERGGSESDSVAMEEAIYDTPGEDETSKSQRKRSYWLSKGVDLS